MWDGTGLGARRSQGLVVRPGFAGLPRIVSEVARPTQGEPAQRPLLVELRHLPEGDLRIVVFLAVQEVQAFEEVTRRKIILLTGRRSPLRLARLRELDACVLGSGLLHEGQPQIGVGQHLLVGEAPVRAFRFGVDEGQPGGRGAELGAHSFEGGRE